MHAALKSALLCFSLGIASVARGEPTTMPATAPTTAPAEATALVEQLVGDDMAQRETARQAILQLGEDALPALQAARKSTHDPDVQVRLDTLLVQVRERLDVGATHVTLQFDNAPLDVILTSLGKQSHSEFSSGDVTNELGGPNSVPRISLDLHDASFWHALQEIEAQANVVFNAQGDGWHVQRNFGQQSGVRGSESGAFLFQPTTASYSRSVGYARNMGGGESFMFQFQVFAEPKVKLSNGVGTITFDRAVDSNGNDLLGAQRAQQVGTGSGQGPIGCAMQLKYPKNPGATISEIRGTLKVTMARRVQQISSDDIVGDKRVEGTIDGVKVIVESMPQDPQRGGIGVVYLGVTIEAAGDLQAAARLQQNFQQQVHVTDSQGASLRIAAFTQLRSDARGGEFRINYSPMRPQQSNGPYKVRVDVPSGFRELEVPFSMRDLRMP